MRAPLLLMAALAACRPARADEAEFVRLWRDLAKPDADGYRAVWALVDRGDEAVAFLGRRLEVMGKPDDGIARLLRGLDDDDFETREAATEKLIAMGEVVEPHVRRLSRASPSAEVRRRCLIILERITGTPLSLSGEELRQVRAVHALQQIGTPAAVRVLTLCAEGPPGFRLTQDARRAVEELKGFNPVGRFPFP